MRRFGFAEANRARHATAGMAIAFPSFLFPCLLAAPPASGVVVTREYGLDFVTVGAPGNRGATPEEAPLHPAWATPLGAVDHEYRIMRTLVSNEQWLDFVTAYAPHCAGPLNDPRLTGFRIYYTGTGPSGQPTYWLEPGKERQAADMSWRIAARYANWLHNGKVNEAWAFETGAYDTSTFGEVEINGITMLTDQVTHSPGARFWIPTLDELAKAAYHDPDRYGAGQEGFWLYPDRGDEQLVAGPPGIGEAAGDAITNLAGIDLGSYPDSESYWGLLDVSSTERQYAEGWIHPTVALQRMTMGSSVGDQLYWFWDRVDAGRATIADLPTGGLRVAAAVPCPAASPLVAVMLLGAPFRRRR